jgi:hypothetical protein
MLSEKKKNVGTWLFGNAAYIVVPLRNPVNDATLISGELKKIGFEYTTITEGAQNQIKWAISHFGDVLGTDKKCHWTLLLSWERHTG